MLEETLAVFAFMAVLTAIGAGPAVAFLGREGVRIPYAAAIAPALGLAIVLLLAFPLVRYIAPSGQWAVGLILFLSAASIALLVADVRRQVESYRAWWNRRAAGLLLYVVLCIGALTVPMIAGGIQHVIVQSNYSDAFFYMSFADSTRLVDWPLLIAGADWGNREAVARLATVDPTALFTARFLKLPLQISPPVVLGAFSALSGLPVHRLFYAFEAVGLAASIPVMLVLAHQLGIRWRLALPLAAAVGFGFWAQIFRETDAMAAIIAMPLFLLATAILVESERHNQKTLSRERLLLALVGACLAATYLVFVAIVGLAGVIYICLTGLVERRVPECLRNLTVAALLALALLVLTGQLPVFIQVIERTIVLSLTPVAGAGSNIPRYLYQDLAINFFGLAAFFDPRINVVDLDILAFPARVFAIVLVLIGLFAAYRLLGMTRVAPFRVLAAFLLLFFLMGVVVITRNHPVAQARTMFQAFPYGFLLIALAAEHVGRGARSRVRGVATGCVLVWLYAQIAMPVYSGVLASKDFILHIPRPPKSNDFDLSAMRRTLKKAAPRFLMIDVPPEKDWVLPFYVTLVFKEFSPYLQAGVIVDNAVGSNRRYLSAPSGEPDYVIVRRSASDTATAAQGRKIMETRDLSLYAMDD